MLAQLRSCFAGSAAARSSSATWRTSCASTSMRGRVLATVVYQASPSDPIVLGSVVGLFVAIGVLASFAPVRRSLRIDPMQALRVD
jgi:ABC-type antimicrobial peptide transport system permease subunit